MAMAEASSPSLKNSTVESSATIPATNASRNLRGLNKPKCIQCGNVARSRCPYQSCKSCCSKAQNPCRIHVLKSSSTFPDSIPSSSSHVFEQQSSSSPSGNSLRIASLRQLSNNFSQFNNLQSPIRSRKPLTRKDAALINEWRFSKLKEFRERNIEVGNEAFDRYMQNVSLLEEVFSANPPMNGKTKDRDKVDSGSSSLGDTTEVMIPKLKVQLRSNPTRSESLRRQYIINQGLKKLQDLDPKNDCDDDPTNLDQGVGKQKKQKSERAQALNDLIDRLGKARNVEDLEICQEMKLQLFSKRPKTSLLDSEGHNKTSEEQSVENNLISKPPPVCSPADWFSTTSIDHESLSLMDSHFSSLEDIEDL